MLITETIRISLFNLIIAIDLMVEMLVLLMVKVWDSSKKNYFFLQGGDGGDRRSMGVSGYRGTGGGGAGQGGQRFPIRDGGAGQRGAGFTTGRFQSNQNSGNTFGARPQGCFFSLFL